MSLRTSLTVVFFAVLFPCFLVTPALAQNGIRDTHIALEHRCASAGDTIEVRSTGWPWPSSAQCTCIAVYVNGGTIGSDPDGIDCAKLKIVAPAEFGKRVHVNVTYSSTNSTPVCRSASLKILDFLQAPDDPWFNGLSEGVSYDEGFGFQTFSSAPNTIKVLMKFEPVCWIPFARRIFMIQTASIEGRLNGNSVAFLRPSQLNPKWTLLDGIVRGDSLRFVDLRMTKNGTLKEKDVFYNGCGVDYTIDCYGDEGCGMAGFNPGGGAINPPMAAVIRDDVTFTKQVIPADYDEIVVYYETNVILDASPFGGTYVGRMDWTISRSRHDTPKILKHVSSEAAPSGQFNDAVAAAISVLFPQQSWPLTPSEPTEGDQPCN